jgi:hypothetical protein
MDHFVNGGSLAERRTASFYTPQQRAALEDYYVALNSNAFRTRKDSQRKLEDLSAFSGLSKDQIRMWLRNRKKRGAYKGKIVYDVDQVRVLEWLFSSFSNYPSSQLKKYVAEFLGMSYSQIQKWFQTRRQRGVPALLSWHSQDEEEWTKTLSHLQYLIEKSKKEENVELEENPLKRRRIEDSDGQSPSSFVNPYTPDFSPDNLDLGNHRPIPTYFVPPPAFDPFQFRFNCKAEPKAENSRLPSVREILQGVPFHPEFSFGAPIQRLPPSQPYFPFALQTPIPPPPGNLSISRFFLSDEQSLVLPPLHSIPNNLTVNQILLPPSSLLMR